ncbi:unnamed protein product [Mytilus edulis]|uniref:B box-type domain-containing protein n=1 Tax=Mytilus edulis TaxID=6550 RepID=A0A8S3PXF8_MYTED|nr:unnamed protein product [Mytilus edulis]
MTSTILCGICHYDDTIKDARQWCINCEEGLCEDCEKVHRSTKNTRTHKIISIIDYQQIKDVLSTAFTDLEVTINGALQNSEKNIIDIKSCSEAFDKQEDNIKGYIKEMREKLNKHLDDMEHKLTTDFSTKSEYCKTAYANIIKQLISTDDKLAKLKKDTENLKRIASDKQTFLGTREIGKVVEKEIKLMKTICDAGKSYEIALELDANIISFLNNVSQLGRISIKEENANLQFKETKLNQAQMQVSLPLVTVVQALQLKEKFKLEKAGFMMTVTGCIMLQNGDMLIADHWDKNIVLISNESDKPAKYINISDFPYDITIIDHNLIAITHGSGSNTLDVLNLSTGVVEKEIQTQQFATKHFTTQDCYGISYWDDKLYVMVERVGIVVIDTSGKALETLPIDTEKVRKVVVFKDRIYYTNRKRTPCIV